MVAHKHDTDYPGHCLVNLPDPGYCARFSDLACVPIFKLIHQQDSTLNEQWSSIGYLPIISVPKIFPGTT